MCDRLRCIRVVASALAVLAWTVRAAADPCPVEVTGAATEEWNRAAHEVAASELADGDCARIDLAIAETGARVTFTTRDGRRAERDLKAPAELASTVEALRVTGPRDEPAPAPQPEQPEPKRSITPLRPPQADAPPAWRPGPGARASGSNTVLALQGGVRGGDAGLISPVVGGSASLLLGRWELGILAALELQYFDPASERAPSSAAVLGVLAGRRVPSGEVLLLGGARLMLAAINDETRTDTGEQGGAELRLGAYSGIVLPRESKTRFRADLGLDLVAAGADQTTSGPADQPQGSEAIAPAWAVSMLLGLEIGGR